MASCPAIDIAALTGAVHHGRSPSGHIEHLLTDSRKLVFPGTTLFFAIKTESGDGHDYVEELYVAGVRNFVVSALADGRLFPEASFFVVDDALNALQQLVAFSRKKFTYPVIGITGSNGKTIVKEWLNHLLQDHFSIIRSPRSWNSQLGVPLSVWQMEDSHDLAIFEAGISLPGEMKRLEKIVSPTMGIMTNIGEAHSEGFVSIQEKLKEKIILFAHADIVVYCKDQSLVDAHISACCKEGSIRQTLSWGLNPAADIVCRYTVSDKRTTHVAAKYNGLQFDLQLPFIDHAAIENAMHCFAAACWLGLGEKAIPKLAALPPLSMRMEMKQGVQGCLIINDSYNADLTGLLSALDFMMVQQDTYQRTAILSDLTGVGSDDAAAYEIVAEHLRMRNVDALYAVGERFHFHAHLFRDAGITCFFYPDVAALLKNLRPSSFRDRVILVKGARKYRFERVSQLLESKVHRTRMEIDLSSLSHNLAQYRSRLRKEVKIMAMVKAFSYGAGSFEVANLLQLKRVDYLAVAYADEGVALRKSGIRLPIMVMNAEPSSFQALVEYDLEPELYSYQIAETLQAFLQAEGVSQFPVHIKLDTGMHRLGFDAFSLGQFTEMLCSGNLFVIKSVFTHLVAAEDPVHDAFSQQQLRLFDEMCQGISAVLPYSFLRHAANTAAIARFPQAAHDMVRLGIGLYGIDPSDTEKKLIESATLKTTIAQIREVMAGESVGYGRKALLTENARIATIRIGYADGYPRALGNGVGKVLIRGHEVHTVGQVCMDMTMVDITGLDDISLDDDVVVFGPELSIVKMARAMGSIPYEIMTGISQRVPRVYFSQ